jgi:class 3 adenylate cyclase/tetratricopeptide (TPR) repeat protein
MALLTCHSCGAAAGPDQRFCGDCGTPLASGCPNCGTTNPPGQRFCGTCGTRLDGAAAPAPVAAPAAAGQSTNGAGDAGATGASRAREGSSNAATVAERRLVSVLFADLVGFTPFAEERDSEEVRDTLTRYFDLATSIITRHGGTVEKFIGDAVMAVWGTPTTKEDDAERSVRAALELVGSVGELGPGIQARAGVLTGETTVTLGAQNQGMVAGDVVNTAARLQSAAAPGTVLVGESTHRAASVAIQFEPAGEQVLKGKAAPVQAWRALRVVAERGGRGRADQLEAPFVGRDMDLRLIKDLFHATGAERRVRHVNVVGTAGIGKSRLAWEFEKYLDGIEENVRWHHGRSPAYGQGVTFWSLGEMIRSRAGLKETDDQDTTRERIAEMLEQWMPNHPNRTWVEKSFLQLLGVGGGVSSTELFGAWRAFFEALSATGTVILVFQDVHWADHGTLEFIDHLVEWSREFPIFILTLARPEILDERPEWGAARRSFNTMFLEPIGDAAMRELLLGLVPGLPEPTIKAIVAQAEGVPLFAVEIIRMLVTTGELQPTEDGTYVLRGDVSEVAVPETLTALIGARLDALDPQDRALILDAAVLGTSFTPEGLAAVSGRPVGEVEPRLKALTRRELLRHVADERSPERGQYAFVQALVRETAYNTLARKDRQVRHLAAARWFETLGEPELAGALAGHFLSARSLAPKGPEADALAAQARIALKAAGDRAASLGSNRQAIDFYQQALTVTIDPLDEAAILELVGEIASRVSEFDNAEAVMTRALEIHRERGDRASAARVTADLAAMILSGRRYDRGRQLLADALLEFAELGEDVSLLRIKSQQARLHMLTQEDALVMPLADEVLQVAERIDDDRLITDTMITRGTALANLRRWREGSAVIDKAMALAEAAGLNDVWLRGLNNSVLLSLFLDPADAKARTQSGLALALRIGFDAWVRGLWTQLASFYQRLGDWDEALEELDRLLADTTDARTRENMVLTVLAIRASRGENVDEHVRELEATTAEETGVLAKLALLDAYGWRAFAAGRLDEAATHWSQLVEMEPSAFTAVNAQWLARLAIWNGDVEAADRWQSLHWEWMPHGGAAEVDHLALITAVQALRGDRAGAVPRYRDMIRRYGEFKLDLEIGYLAIDLAYVLGPTEAVTLEAVAIGRAALTANHARLFLDQLEVALAHGAHPVGGREAPSTQAKRSAGVRTS